MEAALVVANSLPELLGEMDDVALTGFVAQALAVHEVSPTRAVGFLRMESESGQAAVESVLGGVTLRSMHRQLTMYARAHCGQAIQVRPGGERSFTDGRHLYLPDRVNQFGDERDQAVYLVRAAQAAGFIEFGSLDIDLDEIEGPWVESSVDEKGSTALSNRSAQTNERVIFSFRLADRPNLSHSDDKRSFAAYGERGTSINAE